MSIHLTDDGTLDTVLRCDECGEEFRFNWDGCEPNEDRITQMMEGTATYSRALAEEYDANEQYQAWVEDCIAEIKEEHECHAEAESEHECVACAECGEPLTEIERDNGETCGRCLQEQNEPQEGDLVTSDHRAFYQYGKRVLWAIGDDGPENGWQYRGVDGMTYTIGTGRDCNDAVQHYMARVQYWPNVWWISDHGNAHRMDLK